MLSSVDKIDLPQKKEGELPAFPEVSFLPINDYKITKAPPMPLSYIQVTEQSKMLDIEYEMDEDDYAWLDLINKVRKEKNLPSISGETFELLMDRLEKESILMASNKPPVADDEAICSVCLDGDCLPNNVILFCDVCNLAVHQDCYGVPYVPESQWLCRRCLESPSKAVDCVLCPNTGGAFKQTDRGHWAHVICALWIPHVRFANPVFMEPIDSIETVPTAFWKRVCYICQQKGVGACMKCGVNSCHSAFHVTCAQLKGLYMKITKPSSERRPGAHKIAKGLAFCETHSPVDYKTQIDAQSNLLERHIKVTSQPIVCLPVIPPEKIQQIASLLSVPKKNKFMSRLLAYWSLKRQMKNGVPLIRSAPIILATKKTEDKGSLDIALWKNIKNGLEKGKELSNMILQREKLKRELMEASEKCTIMKLHPFGYHLKVMFDSITKISDNGALLSPEFLKVKNRAESYYYWSLDEFMVDFNPLMSIIQEIDESLFFQIKSLYQKLLSHYQTDTDPVLEFKKESGEEKIFLSVPKGNMLSKFEISKTKAKCIPDLLPISVKSCKRRSTNPPNKF